jgi:hypothetical protein
MTQSLLVNILFTLVGAFYLVQNIRHLRNPEKLVDYMRTSPKAALWVNSFGEERAVVLARKCFLPVGTLIALSFLMIGLRNLYHLMPSG